MAHKEMAQNGIHGLLAEFENPGDLLHAARRAYAAGYRKMDAYSPFPVHGLAAAIGFRRNWVATVVLAGGLTGLVAGVSLCIYMAMVAYPLNIGGRPDYSWPAFIPIAFETTVLLAALSAVAGMIALNGLPKPYNPLFNAPNFDAVSRDRFFLCIEAADPLYDSEKTREFLESLYSREVVEVAS
jgi:hypothetical protein